MEITDDNQGKWPIIHDWSRADKCYSSLLPIAVVKQRKDDVFVRLEPNPSAIFRLITSRQYDNISLKYSRNILRRKKQTSMNSILPYLDTLHK